MGVGKFTPHVSRWKKGLRKYSKITIRRPKEKAMNTVIMRKWLTEVLVIFCSVESLPPLPLKHQITLPSGYRNWVSWQLGDYIQQ